MPAPAKTSDTAILAAASRLIDRHGPDGATMADIAKAVGVRTPSLYKRFSDREAILRAVECRALAELTSRLNRHVHLNPPVEALIAMAHTYQSFARSRPGIYALMFSSHSASDEDVNRLRSKALAPVFVKLGALVPESDVLPLARTLTAFLHGFVTMRAAGAFHMGGSVDRAFDYGIKRILSGADGT